MVLAGGPDCERDVSLQSGEQVAAALRTFGHRVRLRDIGPEHLGAIDQFLRWPGDVMFCALHGKWGEGGGVQRLLEQHGISFVGCGAAAATRCMDKARTKRVLGDSNLPTAPFELLKIDDQPRLEPPVVVKPTHEGSSIDLAICHNWSELDAARKRLHTRHATLMIERYIAGSEIAVGIVGGFAEGERALPAIQIVPATDFYDYDAKYVRNDTRYLFDDQSTLSPEIYRQCETLALMAHQILGARDLSRVDLIVDRLLQPWILELNTIPGFTTHSLVPMAASRIGMNMPALVNQLASLANNKTKMPSPAIAQLFKVDP